MLLSTLLPSRAEIEAGAQFVYDGMPATPQYCWPLLCERLGTEVWLKHENHAPIGAFKVRGGLVYFANLVASNSKISGVISATRGNHGQSVGLAARRYGIPATIVVPYGNSIEKNAAMRALGVELIEHGEDFQAAREYAEVLAQERSLHMVPSFDRKLVTGVASYSMELLQGVPDLDTVYVPIGMGSGVCGMVAARNALGLKTKIVGVVSAHARAYAASFKEHKLLEAPVTTQIADGLACRVPHPDALQIIWQGVDHIVEVTDQELGQAICHLYECTHNMAEGAGAAATAAAFQEQALNQGRKIALVLSGGNIDREVFAKLIA